MPNGNVTKAGWALSCVSLWGLYLSVSLWGLYPFVLCVSVGFSVFLCPVLVAAGTLRCSHGSGKPFLQHGIPTATLLPLPLLTQDHSSSAFSSVVGQNHRSTESLKMGNTSKVIQGFQKAEGSFL